MPLVQLWTSPAEKDLNNIMFWIRGELNGKCKGQ